VQAGSTVYRGMEEYGQIQPRGNLTSCHRVLFVLVVGLIIDLLHVTLQA
jgi:hypothetical protein